MQSIYLALVLMSLLFLSFGLDAQQKNTTKSPAKSLPKAQNIGKQNNTSPQVVKMTPQAIAKAMVKAVRINDALMGKAALATPISQQEELALNLLFEKAKARNKEITLDLDFKTVQEKIRGLYISRRSAMQAKEIPQKFVEYEARLDKVHANSDYFAFTTEMYYQVYKDQRERYTVLPGPYHDLILDWVAIVFYDFLWEGSNWKKGNPESAKKRLESIYRNGTKYAGAATKWKQTVRYHVSNSEYASWSLLSVDALFVNDEFQENVFEKALPFAEQELLNATPKINLSGQWEIDGKFWELKPVKKIVETEYLQSCISQEFWQMISGRFSLYCDSSATEQVCAWVDNENRFHIITSIKAGVLVPSLFCSGDYEPTSMELKGSCLFCNFSGKLTETPKGFTAKRIPK